LEICISVWIPAPPLRRWPILTVAELTWYGVGLSEARFGLALHSLPRDSFVVQTKVGRFLLPDSSCQNGKAVGWLGGFHNSIRFEYTAVAFEQQLYESLQRTGLGRIDSLVIHDIEPTPHRKPELGDDGLSAARKHLDELKEGGFAELLRMRASGRIRAFGAGVNTDEDGEDPEIKRAWNKMYVHELLQMHRSSAECEEACRQEGRGIDFLLCAGMYSLLNHEAYETGILDQCAASRVGVIVGGPYSSGILATG